MTNDDTAPFFELSTDLISISSMDGCLKRVNSAFRRTLGFDDSEILAKTWFELIHPDDLSQTMGALDRLKTGRSVFGLENRVVVKDGSYRWIAWTCQAMGDQIYSIGRDVTALRQYHEALEISESRFRKLFENAPFSLQIFSPDGTTLDVNQAWKELWGMSDSMVSDKIIGKYNVLNDPQLEEKGIAPFLREGFAGKSTQVAAILYEPKELEPLRRESRARWVEAQVFPILSGEVVREVVLMHWDVTKRMQYELALKLLSETAEFLAVSLDAQTRAERIAELAVKWLGDCCQIHRVNDEGTLVRVASKCVGTERALAILSKSGRIWDELPPKVHAKGEGEFELDLAGRFGEDGPKSMICVPMRNMGRVIGTITLVTGTKFFNETDFGLACELAERAALAIQNAKLYEDAQSAIRLREEFLSVASHELKTPLTPLSLQIQTLLRQAEKGNLAQIPPDKVQGMLKSTERQLERLTELVEKLLEVSGVTRGKVKLDIARIDLGALASELLEGVSENSRAAGCSVTFESEDGIVGFWDRVRIEQIVGNLISNALKFGKGKPIHVRVWREADLACLSVSDQGIGVEKSDQARIFDRFERAVSSTSFGGFGLGLFMVWEFTRLHGGNVSVESESGKGATFTVRLPIRAGVAPDLTRSTDQDSRFIARKRNTR